MQSVAKTSIRSQVSWSKRARSGGGEEKGRILTIYEQIGRIVRKHGVDHFPGIRDVLCQCLDRQEILCGPLRILIIHGDEVFCELAVSNLVRLVQDQIDQIKPIVTSACIVRYAPVDGNRNHGGSPAKVE